MNSLQHFRNNREFHPIDWEFGDLLARHASAGDQEEIALLGAMAIAAVRQEHSCLDLAAWSQRPQSSDSDSPLPSPFTPQEWLERLASLPDIASADPSQRTPLVFNPALKLVYLHKYRQYEQIIADFIRQRLPHHTVPAISPEAIHAANSYFSAQPFAEDHQQLAAALALERHFAIITGGPGTGKTTVLATILALELERQPDLRIALAAPTGKAAARMTAAIAEEIHAGRLLTISDANAKKLAALPAKTIHALIGAAAPGQKPRFHRENQLACDLAVIDEASMASLPIMARLLDALPPTCRLLLLGDKDQLTSVEAGSVLADLCANPELENHVARLIHNYRSAENTALCDFVKTIAAQESLPDLEGLYSKRHPLFQAQPLPRDSRREALQQTLAATLEDMLTDGFSLSEWQNLPSYERAFAYSEHFKILAALRDGPFGVVNLNRLMAEILNLPLYANGAPVLVLANDYVTDLRNGDVGICWDNQVYFARPPDPEAPDQNRYAAFSRIQLPPHELVFAMTIHKAQGSGFDNVLMTLPENDNPVLSRELVYTGITRTKRQFRLWAPKHILQNALQRPTRRWSGLMKTPST